MAGKYAKVIDQLPRLNEARDAERPDYQEKINQAKIQLTALPGFSLQSSTLAALYADTRKQKDGLTEQLAEVQIQLTALEQLVADQFENEGVGRVTLASGESVFVGVEPYAQCVDRDATRLWAVANGLERNLQLPWMTLNAITKERLLNGQPEPDGVTCYAKTKVTLRKG